MFINGFSHVILHTGAYLYFLLKGKPFGNCFDSCEEVKLAQSQGGIMGYQGEDISRFKFLLCTYLYKIPNLCESSLLSVNGAMMPFTRTHVSSWNSKGFQHTGPVPRNICLYLKDFVGECLD